jgi:hypothetical protein
MSETNSELSELVDAIDIEPPTRVSRGKLRVNTQDDHLNAYKLAVLQRNGFELSYVSDGRMTFVHEELGASEYDTPSDFDNE